MGRVEPVMPVWWSGSLSKKDLSKWVGPLSKKDSGLADVVPHLMAAKKSGYQHAQHACGQAEHAFEEQTVVTSM